VWGCGGVGVWEFSLEQCRIAQVMGLE